MSEISEDAAASALARRAGKPIPAADAARQLAPRKSRRLRCPDVTFSVIRCAVILGLLQISLSGARWRHSNSQQNGPPADELLPVYHRPGRRAYSNSLWSTVDTCARLQAVMAPLCKQAGVAASSP